MNPTPNPLTRPQNQAIALAGLLQCVSLVREIARSGYLNSQDFTSCIQSLFITNPDSTQDVYGDLANIERGLSLLSNMLNSQLSAEHKELLHYAVGVRNLAKRFSKNKTMLSTVGRRLEETNAKIEHFGITHDNVIANIADIYTSTISTFSYRIQVKGEYNYLQQKRVADQIRALLLAGVRAAVLWQQNGGSIFKLLLTKGALKTDIEQLLRIAREQSS